MVGPHAKDYARRAEPFVQITQDNIKSSLELKRFVRGLDPPMPTFRLPAEQQPEVMPCLPSLPSRP